MKFILAQIKQLMIPERLFFNLFQFVRQIVNPNKSATNHSPQAKHRFSNRLTTDFFWDCDFNARFT